jgi:quercetin dioxygenase-like cupin family protein
MDKAKVQKVSDYPEVITRLPEAEIAFEGAKAWILQAESHQLVFFQFKRGMELPAHSHSYDQWGIVVDGEMELTVAGEPRVCRKGDEYLVPAGATHSAKFFQPTRVMDFFSEKNRYKPKQPRNLKSP